MTQPRLWMASARAEMEVGSMAAGEDPAFEREAGGVGRDDEEVVGLEDDAVLGDDLLLEDVAEDAAFAELEVAAGAVDLFLNAFGNDGQGDELGVGVLERGAGGLAVVLEDEDVAEAGVFGQVEDAIAEGEEDVGDLVVGHGGEGGEVVRDFR